MKTVIYMNERIRRKNPGGPVIRVVNREAGRLPLAAKEERLAKFLEGLNKKKAP